MLLLRVLCIADINNRLVLSQVMNRSRQHLIRQDSSSENEDEGTHGDHQTDSDEDSEEQKLNYMTSNLITEPNINVSDVKLEDITQHSINVLEIELIRKVR